MFILGDVFIIWLLKSNHCQASKKFKTCYKNFKNSLPRKFDCLYSLFIISFHKICRVNGMSLITLISKNFNEYSTARNSDCLHINFIKHLAILFKWYAVFNKITFFLCAFALHSHPTQILLCEDSTKLFSILVGGLCNEAHRQKYYFIKNLHLII